MPCVRDKDYWDRVSDVYDSDDQGDAPDRVIDRLFETEFLEAGDCVLEVGSGPGTYSIPLAQRVRIVVCMDSSAGMLDRLFERARGMGLTNMERFHKDWGTYVPRKGYDLCLASLLPGSESPESMLRMEGAARRGCAILSWDRLGHDDLTADILGHLGMEGARPRRGCTAFEEWLSENGREYHVDRFDIHVEAERPYEEVAAREEALVRALGADGDVASAVRGSLDRFSRDGVVRMVSDNVLKMVRWKSPR